MRVSCVNCSDFERDKVGDGTGIGTCLSYQAGRAKKPSAEDLEKAFKARGGYTFYPDVVRVCKLFKTVSRL